MHNWWLHGVRTAGAVPYVPYSEKGDKQTGQLSDVPRVPVVAMVAMGVVDHSGSSWSCKLSWMVRVCFRSWSISLELIICAVVLVVVAVVVAVVLAISVIIMNNGPHLCFLQCTEEVSSMFL